MKKIIALVSVLTIFLTTASYAQSCGTTNIALNATATASSEIQFHTASAAVDNNSSSSWESNGTDNEYIYVDLGQSYSICQVVINWSTNGRAANFKIQTSANATSWTDVNTTTGNTATTNTISVSGTGRYVRMLGSLRVNNWSSYEIVDMFIYPAASNTPPTVSLTAPSNNASFGAGANINLTASASDADGTVSKVEFYQGSTKIGESLTSPYTMTWSNVSAGSYSLTAVATDNSNATTTSSAVSITVVASSSWTLTGNSGTTPGTNFLGTLDDQRLVFKTNNAEKMTILSSGFVGIGTATSPNPEAKLAVNGPVYATKLKVTQNGWSDYVFGKNYKLMTLSQVEAYIKQHSHLPGVPSATEMKENGNDVGTTQSTLLKKIEELTLYLIEQNKRIEEQQQEIEELKKQVKKN